ncbi:MAG: TRAP transporter small permease [Deltaproteobacteria bacterium]|nr:MAG: TRAP transporter small permease [Deltaproteobacteria bacterium]
MLDQLIDRMVGILKVLSAVCIGGTMSITCADVIGRFFGHPILGAVELGVLLAALALGFSLPYAHRQGAHVGVEILYMLLGKKGQAAMRLFTGVAGAALFAVIAYMCASYALDMKASGEVSMTLQLPLHPVIMVISGCFWVLMAVQIYEVIFSALKEIVS